MTNDTRTADEIERDIEEERARMSGTINELQKKFSVEAIVSDLGAMFRGQGEVARSISQTIGRNPAAVALVGVGLAWLFLGQGRASASAGPSHPAGDRSRRHRDVAPGQKWDSRSRSDGAETGLPEHPTIPAHASFTAQDGNGHWFNEKGASVDRQPRRQGIRSAAANGQADDASGIIGSLRDGADAVAGVVSQAAGAVRDTATDLAERLSAGTEGFSDEARARVLAARRAAHEARIASQDALKRGGRAATNLFEDQPLVIGALAIALGAAVGGALPNSRLEDDTLGASSDRLFADAQKVFFEERDKAVAVLKSAAGEVQASVKDTGAELAKLLPEGKSAGDVIVEHVSEAAAQVADTARDEAERQGHIGERRS